MSHNTTEVFKQKRDRYEKLRLALQIVTTVTVLILLGITLVLLDDIREIVESSAQARTRSTELIRDALDEIARRSQEQHDELNRELTEQHGEVSDEHDRIMKNTVPTAP